MPLRKRKQRTTTSPPMLNTSLFYQFENFANLQRRPQSAQHHRGWPVCLISRNNSDNVSTSAQGPDILTGYEPQLPVHKLREKQRGGRAKKKPVKNLGNLPSKSTQISYFGRFIYTFDNRYTFQANFRADAFDSSNVVAQTNRVGLLPVVLHGLERE